MADAFLGEIKLFGFDYPPRGWAYCDGQTLSLAQNTALFALLGPTFGGNGKTNFQLPDLRGRVPVGQGTSEKVEHKMGETGTLVSADPAGAPVDEKSNGTLGMNFCIALRGIFPPRQ